MTPRAQAGETDISTPYTGQPWTKEMVETLIQIQSETGQPPTGFLPIILDLAIFTSQDPSGIVTDDEREAGQKSLLGFLHALAGHNAGWLANNPRTPGVYDAGISYYHDHGIEWWADYCRAFQRKKADCKVLASMRCADINRSFTKAEQENGLPQGYYGEARPHISWRRIGPNDPGGFKEGDWVYHVIVRRPTASIMIDPPPMSMTPAGPTLYPAKEQRWDGTIVNKPDYLIEDPSRVTGMGWESIYAESNHKPNSPQFASWFRDRTGMPFTPVVLPGLITTDEQMKIISPYATPWNRSSGAPTIAGLLSAPMLSVPLNFDHTQLSSAGWRLAGLRR